MVKHKSLPMPLVERRKNEESGEAVGIERRREDLNLHRGWEQTVESTEKEAAREERTTPEKPAGGTGDDDRGMGGIIAASHQAQKLKQRQKKIEKVLEAELSDAFLRMTPEERREFRAAGEQTAKEINDLLGSAKIKLKKIIELIKNWLRLIPGVNKFFLEQEAKIKADEIMKIKRNDNTI